MQTMEWKAATCIIGEKKCNLFLNYYFTSGNGSDRTAINFDLATVFYTWTSSSTGEGAPKV
jgi:hypothetical protein